MSTAPHISPDSDSRTIRVMVVDDSSVVRGLMSRWLEPEADLEVVAACPTALDALKRAAEVRPHVILLDVEMPGMDGLAAIPALLNAVPRVKIIMVSGLTQRNAQITVKALTAGAADYLPKPQASLGAATDFQRDLLAKVRALGQSLLRRQTGAIAPSAPMPTPGAPPRPGASLVTLTTPPPAGITLAPKPKRRPEILVIGSSTGGPEALRQVLTGVASKISVPILVTQHMPAMFTTILAEQLGQSSRMPCAEALDGEALVPGKIYIAPGDRHLILTKRQDRIVCALNQDPPENFCRPAVDPLFRSAAALFGDRTLGVVLTGMGSDGMRGAKDIVAAGGGVLAQDEATSVVWGMPGAVAHAGLAYALKPIDAVAGAIVDAFKGPMR